ncbi:hypothetical protein CBR_g26294 [Chara braunii]|uniref:C2H2-type domain-containing protein n=1 Tax=Chara braunii TaxID=69332 RepID=A0A388L7T6_CHABU|nr:hypothetical protein CBR_g26294 [Chara braunii]|eukprot:GBG78263.1 hypothetical protein CBR_g26294 [Chara braunii]
MLLATKASFESAVKTPVHPKQSRALIGLQGVTSSAGEEEMDGMRDQGIASTGGVGGADFDTTPSHGCEEKGDNSGSPKSSAWPRPLFPVLQSSKRSFDVDNLFFLAGNLEREVLSKQAALEITAEEANELRKTITDSSQPALDCPLAGCKAKLHGVEAFASHYNSVHSAMCCTCRKVFPTTRLLNLHVAESHDAFFQAKVARGYKMYECLVEDCADRFATEAARHQHLVDKHMFPRSFRFNAKCSHPSQKQRWKIAQKSGGTLQDQATGGRGLSRGGGGRMGGQGRGGQGGQGGRGERGGRGGQGGRGGRGGQGGRGGRGGQGGRGAAVVGWKAGEGMRWREQGKLAECSLAVADNREEGMEARSEAAPMGIDRMEQAGGMTTTTHDDVSKDSPVKRKQDQAAAGSLEDMMEMRRAGSSEAAMETERATVSRAGEHRDNFVKEPPPEEKAGQGDAGDFDAAMEIENLSVSMSRLRTASETASQPKSICFGRRMKQGAAFYRIVHNEGRLKGAKGQARGGTDVRSAGGNQPMDEAQGAVQGRSKLEKGQVRGGTQVLSDGGQQPMEEEQGVEQIVEPVATRIEHVTYGLPGRYLTNICRESPKLRKRASLLVHVRTSMGHISAMDEELVDAEDDDIPEEVSLKKGKEIAAEQSKVERFEKKRVADAVKEKREKRIRARQEEKRARLEELAAAENSKLKKAEKQQQQKEMKKNKTRSGDESLQNRSAEDGGTQMAQSSRRGDERDGKSADDADERDEGSSDDDDDGTEEEMQGKLLSESIVRALTEREQKTESERGSVSRAEQGALGQSEHWGGRRDSGKEKKNKRRKEKMVNKSTEKLIIDNGLEVAVLPDPGNVGVEFKPSASAASFHREQLYGSRLRRSLGMVAPKGLPGGGGGAALFLGAATR